MVLCNPTEAYIIIVDAKTKEGRKFVADWAHDRGKIMLDCLWVQKCLDAGRVLLEGDNWGECGGLLDKTLAGGSENEMV